MRAAAVFAFFLACTVPSAWTRSIAGPGGADCICTLQYDPVCGKDGKTYGNACAAGCARVPQACKGECPCPTKPGPINPTPPNPAACTCLAGGSPVCSTDGKTYESKCWAACNNAVVACEHECPCDEECNAPYVRCGENPCDTATCPKHPDAECRLSNCRACTAEFYLNGKKIDDCGEPGGCTCTEQYSPVCGADGETYSNDCFAECEGVSIQCKGECPCPTTKPCACTKIYKPVCGTNGKTYSNECLAKCDKAGTACQGECPCKKNPEPCICTKEYQPVCGHDEKTYGNKCEAGCANARIKCTGECPCEKEEEECHKGTVACLVDPCSHASCPAYPGAICKANYCGGCNADFYWNGKKVKCEKSDNRRCAKKDEACVIDRHYPSIKNCCSGLKCCQPCSPFEIQPYGLSVHQAQGVCKEECLLCKG